MKLNFKKIGEKIKGGYEKSKQVVSKLKENQERKDREEGQGLGLFR